MYDLHKNPTIFSKGEFLGRFDTREAVVERLKEFGGEWSFIELDDDEDGVDAMIDGDLFATFKV